MADYYVSKSRGSDSTGTGTASNPWATIGKAIGASPALTMSGSGTDRLYIEPGTYYEAVTLGVTPTATNPLEILGDSDGAGFRAGGYSTPLVGAVVEWAAWLSDVGANNAPCLNGGAKSYVTLRRLKLHGGNATNSCLDVPNGTNWTIADCIFVPYQSGMAVNFGATATPAGAGLNLAVERCHFAMGGNGGGRPIRLIVAEAAAEYSLGTTIRNCIFRGVNTQIVRAASNGLGYLGTGVTFAHCTFLASSNSNLLQIYSADALPLSTPIQVVGCVFSGGIGINCGHASQVAEDWNVFHCSSPRQNVATGANSSASVRPALDWGDGKLTGLPLRMPGEPTVGSPLGGFVGASYSTLDHAGRNRPEGYNSANAAAGALERHDSGVKDATYADATSLFCMKLLGPSSQDRPILVDAATTVISVKVRWDGNHGDANRPQAMLLANPEIGVAAQTVTATGSGGAGSSPNAYQTLAFAPITPTAKGVVMLRMVSRSAAGNGAAYFDTIGIG